MSELERERLSDLKEIHSHTAEPVKMDDDENISASNPPRGKNTRNSCRAPRNSFLGGAHYPQLPCRALLPRPGAEGAIGCRTHLGTRSCRGCFLSSLHFCAASCPLWSPIRPDAPASPQGTPTTTPVLPPVMGPLPLPFPHAPPPAPPGHDIMRPAMSPRPPPHDGSRQAEDRCRGMWVGAGCGYRSPHP